MLVSAWLRGPYSVPGALGAPALTVELIILQASDNSPARNEV